MAEITAPKQTKKAQLIALLSKGKPVNLDTLSSALGWQRHTTSAAMTRLKQEGHNVLSEKVEGQVRTYRIDGNKPAPDGAKDASSHQATNPDAAVEAKAA